MWEESERRKKLYAKIDKYNAKISTKSKLIVIHSATLAALTVVAIMSMNGIDVSSFENVILRIIPEAICSIPAIFQLTNTISERKDLIIEKENFIGKNSYIYEDTITNDLTALRDMFVSSQKNNDLKREIALKYNQLLYEYRLKCIEIKDYDYINISPSTEKAEIIKDAFRKMKNLYKYILKLDDDIVPSCEHNSEDVTKYNYCYRDNDLAEYDQKQNIDTKTKKLTR